MDSGAPLKEYRLDPRILVHRPGIRQWPVDGVEVPPAALEAAQHVGLRDGVSALADARSDALERETGRGDAKVHDLEVISGRFQVLEVADVGAAALP
jgi:hypothetical protein